MEQLICAIYRMERALGKHLFTYADPVPESHLDEICQVLAGGGVVAYPTDVNWALGCDAGSTKAVERMRRIKRIHPKSQPFSLICANMSMAGKVANIDNRAYKVLKKLLPGAYTVILKSNRSLARQIKDKRLNVGIRIPRCALLCAVTERFAKPLATTSMLAAGEQELRFGFEIQEKYGHALDMVIDLGAEIIPAETTIIDFTTEMPIVVRKGAGDVDMQF